METVIKWGIAAGLSALVSLGVLFLYFQVKSQVETQLKDAGYPSSSVVKLMQKDIEANEERIVSLKESSDKLDVKIEKIVDILLEP